MGSPRGPKGSLGGPPDWFLTCLQCTAVMYCYAAKRVPFPCRCKGMLRMPWQWVPSSKKAKVESPLRQGRCCLPHVLVNCILVMQVRSCGLLYWYAQAKSCRVTFWAFSSYCRIRVRPAANIMCQECKVLTSSMALAGPNTRQIHQGAPVIHFAVVDLLILLHILHQGESGVIAITLT